MEPATRSKVRVIFVSLLFVTVFTTIQASVSKFINDNRHDSEKISRTFRNWANYQIIKIVEIENKHSCDKVLFISAFEGNFTICLIHYSDMIGADIEINIKEEFSEHSEILEPQNLRQIYKGTVNNNTESFVYGKLSDNKFDGYFMINAKYYYIEPVTNLKPESKSQLCIIYITGGRNMKRPKLHFDTTDEDNIFPLEHSKWLSHNLKSNRKYSMETEYNKTKHYKNRTKRSVKSMSCNVHLVADHMFYEQIGRKSTQETVSELVYRLGDADVIFRATDFNEDGFGDNIGFTISKITIFTSNISNKLGDESLSVNDYLDEFSQYDFNEYCLAVAFTNRDFNGGVLGLAWVANSSIYGPAGGICQQRIVYSGDKKKYNLNTVVVTMLNYGERILSREFGLVLAHELGHSFGSYHDPIGDTVCSPGDENGHYLMYPYANDGSKPNHNRFSMCSINYIYPVIRNKGGCFIPDIGAQCGNYIVEDDEECDCGDSSTCSSIDHCCSPRNNSIGSDPPCTIRRSLGYECSPRKFTCCTSECKYVSNSVQHICRTDSECQFDAVCNGKSAGCPESENKLDGTKCDNGRKMCYLGVCSKSICNNFGLDLCKCSGNLENECLICCKFTNSSQCFPASSFSFFYNNKKIFRIKHGGKCNSVVGVCDVHGKCLPKEQNVMVNILSEDIIADIQSWLENYWLYILIGIVVAILVVIFVIGNMKTENVHVEAFRLGRQGNVMNSAEI